MDVTFIDAILIIIFGTIIATIATQIINYFFTGPNLKVTHLNRQIEPQTCAVVNRQPSIAYSHTILIRNMGKLPGALIDIVAESHDGIISQSYLKIDDLNKNEVAPISIDANGIKRLHIVCYITLENQRYFIKITYEKSCLRRIYRKTKIIWHN